MKLLTDEELEVIFEAGPSYARMHVAQNIAKAQLQKTIAEIEVLWGKDGDYTAFGYAVVNWLEAARKEITNSS